MRDGAQRYASTPAGRRRRSGARGGWSVAAPRAAAARRALSALLSLLLVIGMAAVVTAPSASADVDVSFVPAWYSTQDNGAVTLAGNSQMTCPTTTGSCNSARSAAPTTAGSASTNNNNFSMAFIDQDADGSTTNSTSAALTLPAGSTVLSALLVWGARRAGNSQGTITTDRARQIAFKEPGAASYATLTGSGIDGDLSDSTLPYQSYLDVTARVKAAGGGTYWVGNLAGTTGADRYAGWSLVVAYRNPAAPLRDLRIFKGFADVTGPAVTIPISGFLTPASGPVSAAVGVVAYEGDRGTTGDAMKFNGVTMSDATRPANNFFASSISDNGTAIADRSPNYPNGLGFDIGRVNATNVLANSQTSTTVALSTNGDVYYPGVITTQIDLFTPAFNPTSKSVVNLSGNDPAKVGDTLRYQVTLTNTGSDPADASVITDPLPDGVTYVPGSLVLQANPGSPSALPMTDAAGDDQAEYLAASRTVRFRVGQGANAAAGGVIGVNQTATVRFQVTLDRAAAGSTVTNVASLAYIAHTIGLGFTFIGNEVPTPVAQIADLAVTKTSDPATQTAGSNVTYRVVAVNNGPNAASDVVLTDTLPAGAAFVSAAPPAGVSCSAAGQVITCTAPQLANGASIAVPIVAAVAPGSAANTQLTDIAEVSSGTGDDVPSNNSASATTMVTRSADVSLTKSVSPAAAVPGAQLTYTLVASNAGPSSANNVVIADALPLGLTYVGSTPAGACANDSGTLTCTIGALMPNQASTVTIAAMLASNFADAAIVNTATATSTTPDPDDGNNTAEATAPIAPSADLIVSKSANVPTANAGTTVTYTIGVRNGGPSDAQGVSITDPAVAGLSVLSAAASQGGCEVAANAVTCAPGTIGAGSSVAVTITARIDAARPAGALTNTALAASATPESNPADNSASATVTTGVSADLSIAKSANPGQIVPGAPVTYTLAVTNAGPSQATGATIADQLPIGLTFAGSPDGCTAVGQAVTCPVGTLARGETRTYRVSADADAAASGDIVNTATVSADTPDPNAANNSASAVSSTSPQADLSIAKSASDPVIAGGSVTYTLTVTNSGPSAAGTVQVADAAPEGVLFTAVSAVGDAALSCATAPDQRRIDCAADAFPVGASTITITGAVAPGAVGTLTNTATVSSTGATDPTPGNNTASATSDVATQADVAVTLSAPAEPVLAGTTVTYALSARNNGPSVARDVVITGQVPTGMTPVLGSSGAFCVYNAGTGTVTCALPSLPPGAQVDIPLQATVDASQQPGDIPGTAIIGSSTPDPVAANNVSTAVVHVIVSADLAVAKSVTPDPLVAGAEAAYTIEVVNNGPSDARTIEVSDVVDSRLAILSANASLGGCEVSGQAVDCTAATLPAGATLTVAVLAQVASDAVGPIPNTAAASSATPDPNGADNQATVQTDVTRTAHLALTKTARPSRITAGAAVTYTLTLVNSGPSDAADVVVDDPLPAGFAVLGVTSSAGACAVEAPVAAVHCDFGAVEAGGTRTIAIRAAADPGLPPGATVTNTAAVTSPTPDSDPSRRTTEVTTPVVAAADLAISKTPVTDPVKAGAEQTYVLQVTNNGPSNAAGVVVDDQLPAGVALVSITPQEGCAFAAGAVHCELGDLSASQTATLQIVVRLDPSLGGTKLANTAAVASAPAAGAPTPDPDPENNTSTATQLVATRSDLSLVKEPKGQTVIAGSTLTYTVRATNNGPSDTTALTIADPIPAGTTLISAIAADGGTCQPGEPLVCSWADVPAGQTRQATVTIAIPADAAVGSILSNTATAESANINTTPDAATDTADNTIGAAADLAVVKSLLSGSPVAGGTATWQIVVRNSGPSQADAVAVSDAAPAGVTLTAATPAGCGIVDGDLRCALGSLAPGGSATAIVTGTLAADYAGASVTNTAGVAAATPDPDPSNNTSSSESDTTTSADLSIVKTADAASFMAGEGASWTIQVGNAGPSTARDVVVVDVVPASVAAAAGAVPGGQACVAAPGTGVDAGSTVLTCRIGDVAPGAPATIAITGTVLASTVAPAIVNAASVTSPTPDPRPVDDTVSTSTPVTASADLSLAKSAPATLSSGEQISWTLRVANAGPSDARGATIVDELPAGISGAAGTGPAGACAADGSTMTCPVGVVPAGGTAEVTIVATIDPSTTGDLTNTATVAATTDDPNDADNGDSSTTTVSRAADISVAKSLVGAAAVPGSVLRWIASVSNAGPSDATEVVFVDDVPAALTGITATYGPAGAACAVSGQQVTCPIGTVEPGTAVAVSISGTLASSFAGATLENAATATSPDDADPPGANTGTSIVPVAPAADLSAGKALVTGAPIAGAPGQYRIEVRNVGPSDAVGVVVADDLPAVFAGAAATLAGASGSCAIDGARLTCAIDAVAVGATPVVIIDGTFTQAVGQTVSNTAEVSASTPDPAPGNNRSTATGDIIEQADLQVTKTGPESAVAGSPIEWQIAVANAGPSDARGVTLSDVLPTGTTGGTAMIDGVSCGAPQACGIGDIPAGQTVTVTVSAAVDASYAGSSLSNTASASSATPDPDGRNNQASWRTSVTTAAQLRVQKDVDPGVLVPGTPATYTITVTNAGPSDALASVLADPLPEGVSVRGLGPSASQGTCAMIGRTASCELGVLPAGAAAVITVPVSVAADYVPDTISNNATISSPTPEPDGDPSGRTGGTITEVTPQADLTLTKTGPESAVAGTPMGWTLALVNSGPSVARDVTIVDAIPAGVDGLAVTASVGDCTFAGSTLTCVIGLLAPGDVARIGVQVTGAIDPAYLDSQLRNTATVASSTPEPNADDPDGGRTSTVVTQVTAQADLTVTKTAAAGAFTAGAPAAWTIEVTNLGPSTAADVVVADALPAQLLDGVLSAGPGSGLACLSGQCALGSLAPGETAVVTVSGTIDPDSIATSIANTASAASATPDPVEGNNQASTQTPVGALADVVIDKAGPATVVAGQSASWTIQVSNPDGPSTARGVRIVDALPAGISGVAVSAPAGATCPAAPIAGESFACDLPDLPAGGDPVTIVVSAMVDAGYADAVLRNAVTAASTTPLSDRAVTSDDAISDVQTSAALSIVKTGPAEAVLAGESISWTVTVSNAGPSVARAVSVADPAPAGVADLAGTWAGGDCAAPCVIGDLGVGESAQIIYTGRVLPDFAPGSLENTAAVSSPTPDPDDSDDSSTARTDVDARADLSLTKTVGDGPLTPGEAVDYVLTAANAGPSDARGALITDVLPADLADASASVVEGDGSCAIAGGVLTCTIDRIAAGEQAIVALLATLSADVAAGAVANTASVTATTPDPDPTNNAATATADTASADLTVVKTAATTFVFPDDPLVYTIASANAGPGPARNTVVTDRIPDGTSLVSASATQGSCTASGQVVTCQLGTVAAGTTATVTVTAAVDAALLGPLTNEAAALSPDESDPSDNVSAVTVDVRADPAKDLAVTGFAALRWAGWAFVLLLSGAAAVLMARRRRP